MALQRLATDQSTGNVLFIDDVTGLIYSGPSAGNILPISSGGGGSVASVFGRTGTITAQSGDYSYAQISGTPNPVDGETPAGSRPGTSFTLAHAPVAGSVKLYRNGVRLSVTTDYTISGATITTVQTIQSGDTFLADYRF